MILIGLYTQEDGNSWWSSRCTWRSMDMRCTRCLRFHSDPARTCKWTVCLTLDFILCDWFLLNIFLFGDRKFILLLNALLWDVRAQRLYIDGYQTHGVNCLCGMPKWQYDQGFCWKAKSCGWWSKHSLCGTALCNVDSQASHLGISQKWDRDCRECTTFLSSYGWCQHFTSPDIYIIFTYVVVGMRGASDIGLLRSGNVCSGIVNPQT